MVKGLLLTLCGLQGNVNGACNSAINNDSSFGTNVETLAWLQQRGICQSWIAVFSFWIVGFILFVWLFILAIVVNRKQKTHET